MSGELLYLDSSVARIEVVRAARRASVEAAVEQRAEEIMAGIHLLKIDNDILDRAARLEPRTLRSLDAIHLASALSLGEDLGAIAIYDSGFAAAATACGLKVLAPAPEPAT